MTDGKTFGQYIRGEFAKLRAMNFTDKRQYIWEYYKIHLLATVIVLFGIGAFINTFFLNPAPRDYIYVAWVGLPVPADQLDALSELLTPLLVEDPTREVVTITFYPPSSAMQQRFSALVQIGMVDVIVGEAAGIQQLSDDRGWLRTLDELPDAPIKIGLYGSPILAQAGIDAQDLYLGVMINTSNMERVLRMIEVLAYEV